MENVLTIIAILGGLLFIFSFIKYAITGFRYHPVTGILALIPVVNLITLPTLMDGKIVRVVIIGIVGLIFSIGAWFLGANESLYQHISALRGQSTLSSSVEQKATDKPITTTSIEGSSKNDQAITSVNTSVATNESQVALPQPVYRVNLPKQALYNMKFIEAPIEQIGTLPGRTVQIITRRHALIEGRRHKATTASVFILRRDNETIAYEMLLSNIKQLKVLITRN
jgi:hypothetical protein